MSDTEVTPTSDIHIPSPCLYCSIKLRSKMIWYIPVPSLINIYQQVQTFFSDEQMHMH